ncbi:MAG: hypothetical protein ACYS8K_02540 [Planctomycetota bacterium]|jgi:sRNA-binding regulator protein Hfq
MASSIKAEWFGKQISILLVNGKSLVGELSEVTDDYVLLTSDVGQTQVMVHAIVAVRLAADAASQQ